LNVLDSCLWIEHFWGTKLDVSITGVMLDKKNLIVPSICVYEVYKQILDKYGEDKAEFYCGLMQSSAKVVNIYSELAMLSAKLSKTHKLAMADSIIYATAIKHNATVWTQDKHFEGLDSVKYFPKN